MKILQTRLRKAREARRLSQTALGRFAGWDQGKISTYESGKRRLQ